MIGFIINLIAGRGALIGVVLGVGALALMWRSDLIEKGERKAVQRIEKAEKKVANKIRRAASKSRADGVRGAVDKYTID